MDSLKGIADVIEHILFELLGLLIPGTVFALTIAGLLGQPWPDLLLQFTAERPWLAFPAAYVLGYAVQGISRPVTTSFAWLLLLPGRAALLLTGRVSQRLHTFIRARLDTLRQFLIGRHTHDQKQMIDTVDFSDVASTYWRARLGIRPGKQLSRRQVQDLSFSVLSSERKQLDRFRAAASLARGVAVAIAVAFVVLLFQLVIDTRNLSPMFITILAGLLVAFYGLMERADMYDGLWRAVVLPQFLCTITRDRPLSPTDGADLIVVAHPASKEPHHN
jgi:hypothetical protein